MSDRSQHRIRKHVLAAATAVVIASMAAPAFAGRVELAGLQSAEQHDQFIVKYRDGSAERADVDKAKAAFGRMAAGKVGGKALGLGHARRMALGADVMKANRKLDRVEAEQLMRQIAADPSVACTRC
jgi:serine protease